MYRYILRMPTSKPGVVQPRPIVLLHGLGLGLFQYTGLLCHMFNSMPDRPILVPLQPHISQRIFHPSFLTPLGRHKTADALAGLLKTLDWVHHDQDDVVKLGASVENPALPVKKGVTILSHSKWVVSYLLIDLELTITTADHLSMPGCSKHILTWSIGHASSIPWPSAFGRVTFVTISSIGTLAM
jgi:hypothetical protein